TELDDYENHILPSELAKASLRDSANMDEKLLLDEVTDDLLELEPADWKEQDHYRVLGLSTLRYRADHAQIKQAYQMRALQFHPDKRAATGSTHDDAFFKCAQKAYNVLIDPVRRRQFDSVDPEIPDDIPRGRLGDRSGFFNTYGPIFEREARFSKKQPVPQLGDANSSREAMESFYRFWTSFESWRSFEYLDKEKEHVENREEKRWLDKKNRAERTRRKTEDNKRISTLVQQAMSLDPRIEMFKEQERQEKEDKRVAKETAARQAEAELRKADERQKIQEALMADQVLKRTGEEKREREAKKQELRSLKKAVRSLAKNNNYCLSEGQQSGTTAAVRSAEIDILLDNMQREAVAEFHNVLVSRQGNHMQMLDEIHGGFTRRTDDELIAKTNELRSGAQSGVGQMVKGLQNKKVHSDDKHLKNEASVRYDGPQLQQQQPEKPLSISDRPWASEEQSQLERALQAYPPSYTGTDRWDKIADSVVGRTKKECKLRVKFLIEQVRSKSK
ncbi:Zuotin, partial [Coemansia sp. RSA 2399]